MSRYLLSPHPQNTPEWYADRIGKATGSEAACVVTKKPNATTRANYIAKLATERLTGLSLDEGSYESPAMRLGKEREPHLRLAYEAATGELLEEAGFAYMPTMPAGCSVDAFMEARRGFLEGKCPNLATHIDYLFRNRVPPEYVPQITHDLYVTGCQYAIFASYCPLLPEPLRLFHIRAERSEFDIEGYEIQLFEFLREVDVMEQRLRERMPLKQAA